MNATRAVLSLLHRYGPLSQADIARMAGLHQSTVFKTVAALGRDGLVRVGETGVSSGGRPPVLLALEASARYAVGVDLGTTTSRLLLVDLTGAIRAERTLPLDRDRDASAVLAQVTRTVDDLLSAGEIPPESVAGMGLALPGLIDPRRHLCLYSPNLGWRDAALPDRIHRPGRDLPITVENSSRAMASAEKWYGRARDVDDFAYIKIGYGIGGAVWVGGRPVHGVGFGAGEIGHVPVLEDGPACACGRRGCLEAVASGSALSRDARARGLRGIDGAKDVLDCARAGSEVAQALVERAGFLLGKGIAIVANLLNPRKVILGGGVAQSADLFLAALRRGVARYALDESRAHLAIEIGTVGPDAAAIGATTLALALLISPVTAAEFEDGGGWEGRLEQMDHWPVRVRTAARTSR